MNDTSELYVRAGEENVTMYFNVSSGMPIYFNISNNESLETHLKRESESGKLIDFHNEGEKYRTLWFDVTI